MKNEWVLVTGGAGFIGSHLVEGLLARGYRVRVLDNFSTGRKENLCQIFNQIELITGDLCDEHTLAIAVRGMDFVLHQAALGSVPRSIDNPLATHECNATGTLKLLLAARAAKVRRVIYASSSSVYGDTPTLPKVESMPTLPLSPYALSKWAGEHYCRLFTTLYGLETVSLRYFNVFGPRQSSDSQYAAVIPCFATKLLQAERIVVFGDGEQTRDFTYVDNVVEANLLAMTAAKVVGETINIACGANYSVNYLVQELSQALNTIAYFDQVAARAGDVRDSYADITKAKQLLDYGVRVNFSQGIKRTAEWFKSALTNGGR